VWCISMTRTDSVQVVHLSAIHITARARARSWLSYIVTVPNTSQCRRKRHVRPLCILVPPPSDLSHPEAMTHTRCVVFGEIGQGSTTTRTTFRRATNGVRTATQTCR
ncbi:hypothetical protein K443DRAFT_110034, partial [Laccaria amethystina LaAM-08-1]